MRRSVAVTTEIALLVGGLTAVAIAFTYPLIRHLTTHLPNDLGDPVLVAWTLGWDAHAIRHGVGQIFNAPNFFPYLHTLAYSDHLIGLAIFTAPVQWLTANPVLTYNLAFIASFVHAGAGMYLLARALTGRRDAAALAALAYAFTPFRVAHLAHLQWLMTGWLPLSLWALHRYFSTGAFAFLLASVGAYLLAEPDRQLLHLLRAAAARGRGDGRGVADAAAAVADRRAGVVAAALRRAGSGAGRLRLLSCPRRPRLRQEAGRDRRVERRRRRLFSRAQPCRALAAWRGRARASTSSFPARSCWSSPAPRSSPRAAPRPPASGCTPRSPPPPSCCRSVRSPRPGAIVPPIPGPYQLLLDTVPGLDGLRAVSRIAVIVVLALSRARRRSARFSSSIACRPAPARGRRRAGARRSSPKGGRRRFQRRASTRCRTRTIVRPTRSSRRAARAARCSSCRWGSPTTRASCGIST